MKRLNKIAKRITAYDEAVEQFIKECENSGKFNGAQLREIRHGFDYGLTMDQVKVYADPKFNKYQMEEIRLSFENGLTTEQVKLYANPRFDDFQMNRIYWDLKNGMSIEEVKEKYNL